MTESARPQKSSFRSDEQPANRQTCPHCGREIVAVTTTGPTEHVAQPCGCDIHDFTINL